MATSHGILRIRNPARITQTLGTFRWSLESAEGAVKKAKRAFGPWAAMGLARRTAALKKFRKILAKHRGDIALAISREVGKAVWESKEEMSIVLSRFDQAFEAAAFLAEPRARREAAYCAYRPYGVAAVLGPFNFPVHLANGHILPALLAGNTVIFKPSDKACGVGDLYGKCAKEANLPPGVLSVVQGPAAVGECLAVHPDVSMVLFTGSYSIGRRIRQLTLDQPDKLLALEMGGKNAAVVFKNADLTLAAAECVRSAYVTTGQRCTSTSRIFVEAGVFDHFCEMFSAVARQFRVGDPLDPEMFCGPVISEDACRRAEDAIREARRLGGDPVLRGGRVDSSPGFFLRLSAHRFRRYPGRCRYTSEELFVPEVGIYPFRETEEAARLVEDTDYGLALAVFTKHRPTFEKILSATTHGVVNWNFGTTGASGKLPFGGRKKSGNARPAGSFAIHNCLYPVAVRVRR